jgi:hypothetical protein
LIAKLYLNREGITEVIRSIYIKILIRLSESKGMVKYLKLNNVLGNRIGMQKQAKKYSKPQTILEDHSKLNRILSLNIRVKSEQLLNSTYLFTSF